MRLAIAIVILFSHVAHADTQTNGPRGINATATGLTGGGVVIGQVESAGRAGKHGYDIPGATHEQVVPFQVYHGLQVDQPNGHTTEHGTEVAGVMIAKGTPGSPFLKGAAPDAILHSGSFTPGANPVDDAALGIDRIAGVPNMRAINLSFGQELQPPIEQPDGNNHLAQYVDWSAAKHDVLYVVAGTEVGRPDYATPQDNYNGITVAASQTFNEATSTEKKYRQAWIGNTVIGDAYGDQRVSVDLLAPGWLIGTTSNGNVSGVGDGTSYAAPHVTAAAALLHEYANDHMDTDEAHSHEVIKSVLLNSADKLNGVHGSTRTVVNQAGQNFTQTSAYFDYFQPLDIEMGAGHLNVESAIENYSAGRHEPGAIPNIGWDFGNLGAPGNLGVYFFEDSLAAGTWVTITLTWDRIIEKIGVDDDDYQSGDTFFERPLNDLNVYLKSATAPGLEFVDVSASIEDNVEHIFFQVDTADNYAIVVQHNGGYGSDQDYALSWWAGDVTLPIPGDFDDDGDVDGDDLSEWKMDFGSGDGSDADGDGDSDGNDFLVWQRNLTGPAVVAANAPVPEPAVWLLAAVGLPVLRRRRQAA